jgi:hypothetical protein
MKDRNFPTDEQVAQIIDILFPIWEHFGNKKGLITHHGAYDSFGERHASSVYTIQFKKCTDVDTEIIEFHEKINKREPIYFYNCVVSIKLEFLLYKLASPLIQKF